MIKNHIGKHITIHSITYGTGIAKYERTYVIDSRWPESKKRMVHRIEAAKAAKDNGGAL